MSTIVSCLVCGAETRRLTRFNAHGRKHFLNRLHELEEDKSRPCLSRSVLPMNEVTCILSAIEQGDCHAASQLLPVVYDELRRLAAQRLSQEKPGQTLEATGLVHEAYVRLVGAAAARRWDNRGHFFAAAAGAMRRILVENARRKRSRKHGGGMLSQGLDGLELA